MELRGSLLRQTLLKGKPHAPARVSVAASTTGSIRAIQARQTPSLLHSITHSSQVLVLLLQQSQNMAQSQMASNLLLLARRAAGVLQQSNAAALPFLQSAIARCAAGAGVAAAVTHGRRRSSSRYQIRCHPAQPKHVGSNSCVA